jgi:hypothetical protein
MTAGSGIIHQEMPKGDGKGRMAGFQLWSNLPAKNKMKDPRYQEVKQAQIPIVKTAEGASVRVIAGEVDGVAGPVREIVTDPEMLDVSLPPGTTFTRATKPGHTVFAYVFEGEGTSATGPARAADVRGSFSTPTRSPSLRPGDPRHRQDRAKPGASLRLRTPAQGAHRLVRPIVMNTDEQLQTVPGVRGRLVREASRRSRAHNARSSIAGPPGLGPGPARALRPGAVHEPPSVTGVCGSVGMAVDSGPGLGVASRFPGSASREERRLSANGDPSRPRSR